MQINGTLFVQGINFLIAYILLRKLLFGPTVAVIQKERAEINTLLVQISDLTHSIEGHKLEKSEQWRYFQTEFLQKIPHVDQKELYVFKSISPSLIEPTIPENEIKRLETALIKKLIEKVGHGG